MTELLEVLRYRGVLWNLVRRNLKIRYKNSILGFAWSLLNPLMQIGVWYFVFKILWQRPEPNFMAFLVTGFLPWLFFSQTVLDSTNCVAQEMHLIKKAYFPRTILPLSALISNLIHLGFAFIVLIGLFALWRVDVNIHYLWVIPATLLVATFAYGLSMMLAAWSVFYADVKFIVANLLGLWFFLLPVLYPLHLVLGKQIEDPANWVERLMKDGLPLIKQIYMVDPLTISIEAYRSALLYGGANPIIVAPTPDMPLAEAGTGLSRKREHYRGQRPLEAVPPSAQEGQHAQGGGDGLPARADGLRGVLGAPGRIVRRRPRRGGGAGRPQRLGQEHVAGDHGCDPQADPGRCPGVGSRLSDAGAWHGLPSRVDRTRERLPQRQFAWAQSQGNRAEIQRDRGLR
jgi:ABC-type polysaccharide/polyol phosphate export permease